MTSLLGFLISLLIDIHLAWSQSLGYSYFKFPPAPSNGYDSFSGIINVLSDPGTSSDGLFMSHQFFFKGGNGGYMGLQTDGVSDQRNNISSPFATGKMAIFSIWDAIDCQVSHDISSNNIECVKGTESGPFYSIHYKFDWTKNDYTLRLSRGNETSWWKVNILVKNSNMSIYIGQIEVPLNWGGVIGGYDSFLEKYSGVSGCQGNFPNYASFSYGQIYSIGTNNVYPYNSSYAIGAAGVKCPCVTANVSSSLHYNVDYTINKALGGCG